MVTIRLRRAGSKKRPFFRVVVTDSRAARDSSFVEILGHYNPRTKPALVTINTERVNFWISKGAQRHPKPGPGHGVRAPRHDTRRTVCRARGTRACHRQAGSDGGRPSDAG